MISFLSFVQPITNILRKQSEILATTIFFIKEKPIKKAKKSVVYRIFCLCLAWSFAFNLITPPSGWAQMATILNLPLPGAMVQPTALFNPAIVRGINIYPDNPFKFDFIIDKGDSGLKDEAFKSEANKLIKYFLASLTIPEDECGSISLHTRKTGLFPAISAGPRWAATFWPRIICSSS